MAKDQEKIKILIVEDQKATAMKIQKDLDKMGYAVTSIVPSGEEVVKSIEDNMPDLVLMDIILEGEMDGIEASEQIKLKFNIPVVFLSAYADKTKVNRAKLTEPFGYLIKPFEPRVLRTTIESALYKHCMEKRLKKYQNNLEKKVAERT
ncbi:MAG: response regulator, partial [Candidatus Anammoxibacter sp.]